MLLPIEQMMSRLNVEKQDSDTAYFYSLLFFGEMLIKIITATMVAAINTERERHRYRICYKLVRADGIGEWGATLSEVVIGPASQHLQEKAREDQLVLTQKVNSNSWQYDSIALLHKTLNNFVKDLEPLPPRVSLLTWFSLFSSLRNRTRGHGAPSLSCSRILCTDLFNSISLLIDHLPLFSLQWVYLHRNLSGKYKVINLNHDTSSFDYLKSSTATTLDSSCPSDGIYVQLNKHTNIELIYSNQNASDFFFPNGNFRNHSFDIFSYATDKTLENDAISYLTPVTELPKSETEGLGSLEIIGKTFTNMPPLPDKYIRREILEKELKDVLLDSRHPVITLVGRGGIGKTSLAIAVLHEISKDSPFEAIIWFSARDIDLLPQGPKTVKPKVFTQKDIATEFSSLIGDCKPNIKGFDHAANFTKYLTTTPTNMPFLFIFDNFETVTNPLELFVWLDTHIRLPNKILITTRHREFKADYPIVVKGMNDQEAGNLIESTANSLSISNLLNDEYKELLFKESDGHPYIIKMLLGEVAKTKKLCNIERIVASKDDVLEALFERTFSKLSPVSKRVFLTLCMWRSNIPLLALEAVLLRPSNEKMDVDHAIYELNQTSFIETIEDSDKMLHISTPLASYLFGKEKLKSYVMRTNIQADIEILRFLGAAQEVNNKTEAYTRIKRLFQNVCNICTKRPSLLDEYQNMLEFICTKYPPAWFMYKDLFEEINVEGSIEKAKQTMYRFLEKTDDFNMQTKAWTELERLCQQTQDYFGELHAIISICKIENIPFYRITNAANRFNELFRQNQISLDTNEKISIAKELVEIFEDRIKEANATDFSRLAWLCLHQRDSEKAKRYTKQGLAIDGNNDYCINLAVRLGL